MLAQLEFNINRDTTQGTLDGFGFIQREINPSVNVSL